MACQTTTNCNPCPNPCGRKSSGYLLVIVLYILLAILVSSFIC